MTTFKNPDYQMGIENTEAEQYAWFWDGARCTGCKACQIACQDYKQLPANMFFRQIYDYTGGSFTVNNDGTYTQNVYSYPISMACNHCGNPACLENCPAGAIFKDSHGFVRRLKNQISATGVRNECLQANHQFVLKHAA